MKPCHVNRGALCLGKEMKDMGADYLRALITYNQITRWALFHENPPCVMNILNSEYWDAVRTLKELEPADDDNFGLFLFLGVAIGAVVVIAILLVVIYIKKNKPDEEESTPGTLVVDSS